MADSDVKAKIYACWMHSCSYCGCTTSAHLLLLLLKCAADVCACRAKSVENFAEVAP
jgi:hypothetical protein